MGSLAESMASNHQQPVASPDFVQCPLVNHCSMLSWLTLDIEEVQLWMFILPITLLTRSGCPKNPEFSKTCFLLMSHLYSVRENTVYYKVLMAINKFLILNLKRSPQTPGEALHLGTLVEKQPNQEEREDPSEMKAGNYSLEK